jgi:hypothetical protein
VTDLRKQSGIIETAVKAMGGLKKIKQNLCLYAMKTYQRSRGITPFILDLGFRWR